MEGTRESLSLCSADLMDYEGLKEAIDDCRSIFLTTSPLTDEITVITKEMLEPSLKGMRKVMRAAVEARVRHVVFMSSIGAVTMDPNMGPDVVIDESCWSNLDSFKNTKNWYCYGKALAEQATWDEANEKGVDLVVINPVLVLSPSLQTHINASIIHIQKYLTGSAKTFMNSVKACVQVLGAALAHVMAYETPLASSPYLCSESVLHLRDVVEILEKFFHENPILTK